MASLGNQRPIEDAAHLLESVRSRGIHLWTAEGQIHFSAPNGSLTEVDLARLRDHKPFLVKLLSSSSSASAGNDAHPETAKGTAGQRFPATFSQRAHWNLYRLGQRRAVRQVASATRLRGPLHIDRLAESYAATLKRHDALRMRMVKEEEELFQELIDIPTDAFRVLDLTHVAQSDVDREIARHIQEIILEPVDPSIGPLVATQLLRLRENDHVLLVAMEHMICDEFSMSVLLHDLFTTYAIQSGSRLPPLQDVAIQLTNYAHLQQRDLSQWLHDHHVYWRERLTQDRRMRFPQDMPETGRDQSGWAIAPFSIGVDLKRELLQWCSTQRTSLVMAVFAAYTALLLRWCDASDGVVLYQWSGRDHQQTEATIGYFTSPLYVHAALSRNDSFVELSRRITIAYAEAREHADHSYYESQTPRPNFTRNSSFNWVPQADLYDFSVLENGAAGLSATAIPFNNPVVSILERDTEPALLLFDTPSGISGGLYFPEGRFSLRQMEKFTSNLAGFLKVLARRPSARILDIPLLR